MGEFQVAGGSSIGASEDLAQAWVPTGGEGAFSKPEPIGMNKPLFVRMHRVFTGHEDHRNMLVSSAVKSETQWAAAPRAVHYVMDRVHPQRFVSPSPAQDGSPIVFCTPANLDQSLTLEVRLAFDDFDRDRFDAWVDLLAQGAQLPVFALSSALGGLLGGAGGTAFVQAAAKGVKVLGRALDRWIDDDNDFIATFELALDIPGLERAQSGWLLLRGDTEDPGGVMYRNPATDEYEALWGADADVFYVDPHDGHLHYKDNGAIVNDLDQPYVLLHISGVTSERLKEYQVTRISAALLEQFFTVEGGVIDDLGELLTIYNDVAKIRDVQEMDRAIKRARNPASKKKLEAERTAILEHVQDTDLRDLLEG